MSTEQMQVLCDVCAMDKQTVNALVNGLIFASLDIVVAEIRDFVSVSVCVCVDAVYRLAS